MVQATSAPRSCTTDRTVLARSALARSGPGRLARIGNPALERGPEHGDREPGGQPGRRVIHPALREGGRQPGGPGLELGQLPLPELGVGGDDGGALLDQRARRLHPPGDRGQAGHDHLERCRFGRSGGHRRDEDLLRLVATVEQHLALVREVTEEGPLGQPGPLGDGRRRGLREPAFSEQSQCRLVQAAASFRLPSAHLISMRYDSN